MPDVYTDTWYGAVVEAINRRVATIHNAPPETLHVAVDIEGDGLSPYVSEGGARHFLIRISGGQCEWYREVQESAQSTPDCRLDYRFVGPAATFDAIIASLIDPIDAALSGAVRVRGDMRFLMRQAELVQVLLEAYTHDVDTTWPKGAPPYA
jgi:putative sterol carrier protein